MPPRPKEIQSPDSIEVWFEIVVVCRRDEIVLQPGKLSCDGRRAAKRWAGARRHAGPRDRRAMVRNRAMVDLLIRQKPGALRFLVEASSVPKHLAARAPASVLKPPDWPVSLQVAGSQGTEHSQQGPGGESPERTRFSRRSSPGAQHQTPAAAPMQCSRNSLLAASIAGLTRARSGKWSAWCSAGWRSPLIFSSDPTANESSRQWLFPAQWAGGREEWEPGSLDPVTVARPGLSRARAKKHRQRSIAQRSPRRRLLLDAASRARRAGRRACAALAAKLGKATTQAAV